MKKLLTIFLLFCCSAIVTVAAPVSKPTIVVLGDSLSASFGIAKDEGWVSLLQQRLRDQHYPHQVINASISGETTAGGLSRIKPLLAKHRPEIVIIELGANDGLRGLSLKTMQTNLERMVELSQNNNSKVVLIGMRLPPNYGLAYTQQFHKIFHEVSAQRKISLIPFLFEGLNNGTDFLEDTLHPNAKAQPHLLNNIWPTLAPLLKTKS